MRAIAYLAAVCTASALVAWGIATLAVGSIERDGVARVSNAFTAAGIDWTTIEADGLKLHLSGTATSESARVRMVETVAQVVSTSRIADSTQVVRAVEETAPDFMLEVLRNNGDLSLIGLIPGSEARVSVLRALADIRDPNTSSDFMEAVDYSAPNGWENALGFGLRVVQQLPRSHVVVRPGGVEVEAFLDSQSDMEAAKARLQARAPSDVTLKMGLKAPKAVVSPFAFAASFEDGNLKVSACSADTEASQGRIYSALSEFGLVTDCQLALGTPADTWGEAVETTLGSLRRMRGGSVEILDTDVTLRAPLGFVQTAFDVENAKVTGLLPSPFSLTAILPQKPKPRITADARPPELHAVLIAEKGVTFDAPLRSQLALDATRNFANARFGSNQVSADLRVDDTLPDGWSVRVLIALDALSLLHAGEVHLTEERLNIFGATDRPDGAAQITALLSEKLSGIPVVADIAFDQALVVNEQLATLSDQDCERALADIMREFQISFSPNSANINDSSRPVVDEIAAVIRTCPDARIEIGGHTDSQGRESMNLGLSQARADAVLDALLGHDILIGNLSAKGYGETQPIADNETEEGRAANRRIAFKLISEETTEDDTGTSQGDGDEPN